MVGDRSNRLQENNASTVPVSDAANHCHYFYDAKAVFPNGNNVLFLLIGLEAIPFVPPNRVPLKGWRITRYSLPGFFRVSGVFTGQRGFYGSAGFLRVRTEATSGDRQSTCTQGGTYRSRTSHHPSHMNMGYTPMDGLFMIFFRHLEYK
jgi:hypothetical protein